MQFKYRPPFSKKLMASEFEEGVGLKKGHVRSALGEGGGSGLLRANIFFYVIKISIITPTHVCFNIRWFPRQYTILFIGGISHLLNVIRKNNTTIYRLSHLIQCGAFVPEPF